MSMMGALFVVSTAFADATSAVVVPAEAAPATCGEMRNRIIKAANDIRALQTAGRKIRSSCIKYFCQGKTIEGQWKKEKCTIPSVGLQNTLDAVKASCDRVLEFDNENEICHNKPPGSS